jgi:elongation factor Ts
MAISAGAVKELRDRTGAGMMECKKALEETGGDMEAAIDLLRTRGAAKAAKRAGREAAEGVVATHATGAGTGSLVEHASGVDGEADGDSLQGQGFLGGSRTIGEIITEVSAKTGERVVLRRAARFDGDGRIGSYVHMTGKIGVLVELSGDASEQIARDVAMHIAASRPLAITADEIAPEVVERERAIYVEQVRQEGKPENIRDKIVEGKLKRFFKEQALVDQQFVKDPDQTVAQVLGGATVRRFVRFELGD